MNHDSHAMNHNSHAIDHNAHAMDHNSHAIDHNTHAMDHNSQVLLRINSQTSAVDMWAAGLLIASMLTGRTQLLDGGSDDQAALAELALITGRKP